MSENSLKIGEIYETVLGMADIDKVLYIGNANSRTTKYSHIIAFRSRRRFWNCLHNTYNVECWGFRDYSLENGKLNIPYVTKKILSVREIAFLNERLKRSGL